ncbi:3-oxoacyl-[acyl-carrier-protein] synthase-3 [Streptosporangium becharense]|uniref:3-oxoacyl-[acyl-carrier-protein] synthase-3 n=1 Tax=Streptosporangium becharense TaxID=1816182 RepID=A0A7W9IJK9_9ACTN|nr:3-oxoacyl-[acyl-carrier-protein] synthase III C-terminal domain-containing protein [Streptosporangium becharense]MBB2911045.1 3-oxoacyl-[acyl-carrier-protein] synthase-3 [Streptosporangium becharense]MBB5821897.1 3-oxoacyl-[acyl-carrier-protein] synthase-3 [Streptosporangium becharense]
MAGPIVDLGISSFGFAYGEDRDVASAAGDYVANPERVINWGFRTFHRAADDVQATDLAAEAARQALDRAGVSADALDLVVLATSDMPEYSYWDGAAALARELKIERTQTLLLNEGCGGGVHGLYYVASTLATQPDADTALLVAVNRVSEFHRNRMNTINAVLSDAAVAVVLRRDHPANRWLATEQFTEPEHCDLLRVDFGGAVNPVPPQGWSTVDAPGGHERIREQFGGDPRTLRRFLETRYERLLEVIDGACGRAGLGRDDITHLIYLNDSATSIAAVAEPLGIPLARTNADLAPDHGHMGAADQLVSLGVRLENGDVAPGDVVALCGISTGRWCATLIRA